MMNFSQLTKSMLVFMACVVLCFCWSLNVYAARDQTNIKLKLLQRTLNDFGFETEIINLSTEDEIKEGTLYLLSVDGIEAIVELSEDGNLRIIDAQAITPMGVGDLLQCITYTIDKLFIDFEVCRLEEGLNPFCYAGAVADFVFAGPRCLKYLFGDFDQEEPPPPPKDDTPEAIDEWCSIGLCEEDAMLKGQCIEFMETCLTGADQDADREQCAGAGFLICIEVL